MRKLFFIFAGFFLFSTASMAQVESTPLQIILEVCTSESGDKILHPIHKTPVSVPVVYWNQSESTIYFENPCYECTLELVVPGTETVAYTYSIPDGDNVVVLPEWLSGQYELHIHRGNFCFWGLIEL